MVKPSSWGHKVEEEGTVAMDKNRLLQIASQPQAFCETGPVTAPPSASVGHGFNKVMHVEGSARAWHSVKAPSMRVTPVSSALGCWQLEDALPSIKQCILSILKTHCDFREVRIWEKSIVL